VSPQGLVEKVNKIQNTRPMDKIRRIRIILKWLQDKLGVAATAMERSVCWVSLDIGPLFILLLSS
jgi:hypothetical protein